MPVRVVPRARQTEIRGVEQGALVVRLAAPPVDGKANKELVDFLAKQLGLRKSQVVIHQGEKARNKIVVLRGVRPEAVLKLVQRKE